MLRTLTALGGLTAQRGALPRPAPGHIFECSIGKYFSPAHHHPVVLRVFIKQPQEEQLDCQTFKGYAYRRACDFQLSYIADASVKKAAARAAVGSTNQEAFTALQHYLDSENVECTRVFVCPYQREKTVEELLKERQQQLLLSTDRQSLARVSPARVRRRTGLKYEYQLDDDQPSPFPPGEIQRRHGPPLTFEYESSNDASSGDEDGPLAGLPPLDDQTPATTFSRSPSSASLFSRRQRHRRRLISLEDEERPIKIRRAPIFIPFEVLKPNTRPRYFLRA